MSKPREWILTSENLVHKVVGPGYSANEEIKVIEYSAYEKLQAALDVAKSALEFYANGHHLWQEAEYHPGNVSLPIGHTALGALSKIKEILKDGVE